MAPEIVAGEAHSFSADVWSLGQLAYQLLSAPAHRLQYLEPGRVDNKWRKTVGLDLRALITKMVDPNPVERPQLKDILNFPWFKKGL